ncbi:hypothetical protein FQN54_004585 [Arachnomyces sp. PD_36]|nr:hypothetical protein FQN54_004585 [Arachnomyces sp. PD_36]
MSPGASFLQFWWTDLVRDAFLGYASKEDLISLRLVCHDFSIRTAPLLFSDVNIQFRSSTFTRPARMAALERIGTYIKTLTFSISHSPETFLPPLLDPATGEEQTFVYTPQVYPPDSPSLRLSVPKYGSWEMTDLLVKQYPPLFHAATNIPSFIRALSTMPSLSHLKISCDGQSSAHRYRRSVVDYTLISLRVAIEQAPLKRLENLSLLSIHPGALLYLRPKIGFGASPAGPRRWAQIRNLSIYMDSFPYEDGKPTDHLKLLHSYLQSFPSLTRLFFRWIGEQKGPSPLSLSTEPCITEPKNYQCCPKRGGTPLKPLHFPSLQTLSIENALVSSEQISTFILSHRKTLRDFDFEDVDLREGGNWDEALAPLTRISGGERWKDRMEVEMDVPIMLSPVDSCDSGASGGSFDSSSGSGSGSGSDEKKDGSGSRGRKGGLLFGEQDPGTYRRERTKKKKKRRRKKRSKIPSDEVGDVPTVKDDENDVSASDRANANLYESLQMQLQGADTIRSRTRELFWGGPDHMKRFLRTSLFSWK